MTTATQKLRRLPKRVPDFLTIGDVERLNSRAGQYWFSPDTLRFFRTRIDGGLLFGRFFVSTEKNEGNPRLASLRFVEDDGSIETVGEFQGFSKPAVARRALEKAIAQGAEVRHDPYEDVTNPEAVEGFNWRCYVGELPIGCRTSQIEARRILAQVEGGLK